MKVSEQRSAVSATATATAPAGAQGTDDSRFFPIGVYYDAGVREENKVFLWPYDRATFFEETLRQLKSWEINTVLPTSLQSDANLPVFFDAATRVGGLNVVYPGDGVGYYGSDCSAKWTDDVAQSEALDSSRKLAAYPAFLAYLIRDEPVACQLANLRLVRSWLDVYDPAHDGFTANYADNTHGWPSWAAEDTTLGQGAFVHDEYPIGVGAAATDPMAYVDPLGHGDWEADLERLWRTVPLDKPWWQVIQVFAQNGWWRMPDRIEARYLVYSALARGAKGIFFFLHSSQENATDDATFGSAILDPDGNFFEGGSAIVPALAHELTALAPILVDANRDDPGRNQRMGGQGCGAANPSQLVAYVGGRPEADCDLFSFTRPSGEKIFALVNKHRSSQVFDLFLNKAWLPALTGAPTLVDPVTGASYPLHDGGSTWELLLPVEAGNGKILRLVPPLAATIEPFKDVVYHAVALGKAVRVRATITNRGTTTWDPAAIHVGVKLTPRNGVPQIATAVSGADLGDMVPPGASTVVVLWIPTGPGTQISTNNSWRVGVDLVTSDGVWFGNEAAVTTFVHDQPLLFDTFDPPPYKHPADFLSKWDRAPLATIREGTLALDGHGATMSHLGDAWSDLIFEFDVKIDDVLNSKNAGWIVRGKSDNGGSGTLFRLTAGTPGTLSRWALANGQLSKMASATLPRAIARNAWIHVRVVLVGHEVLTYLDEALVDTTTIVATTGKVGFYAREVEGDRMHVDDVIVYRDGVVPPAPAPVTIAFTPVSDGVKLTWAASDTAVHYVIWRSDTPGGPYVQAGVRTGTVFRQYGTPPGVSYWVVTAVGADNQVSPYSNEVAGGPPPTVATPGYMTANAVSARTVELRWPPASGAVDHYDVFRVEGSAPTADWTEASRIASPVVAAFDDSAPALFVNDQQQAPHAFGVYTYAVRAVDATGQVGAPVTATVTVPGSALASDGFDGSTLAPWWVTPRPGSSLIVDGSILRQFAASKCGIGPTLGGFHSLDDGRVGDFAAEVKVRIDDAGTSDINWVGMGIRQRVTSDDYYQSGYLVYARANGQVSLYTGARGDLATAWAGASPKGAFRKLRVEARGAHFFVFVDGVKLIDYVDPAPAAGSDTGYVGLASCGVWASYDSFDLTYREPFIDLAGVAVAGSGVARFGQLVLSGSSAATPHRTWVRDFTADFNLQIDSETDGGNGWGGFTFRKNLETDRYWQSGYLVFYRANGRIELYRAGISIAIADTGVSPMTVAQRVRVAVHGISIKIYVNGVLKINVNDATYLSGYLDLSEDSASVRFDALSVY